jgi:hypothetical protein
MSLYKRGGVWWYKFRLAGQVIRESSKSDSKTVARDAERIRRREIEESWNQIKRMDKRWTRMCWLTLGFSLDIA